MPRRHRPRDSAPADRLVRLMLADDEVRVSAAAAAGDAGPDASIRFALPRVPLSLLAWCAAVGEAVWRRHRACVALVLLLDCEAGRWAGPPLIPHQRCGRRRVAWSLSAADFAGLPARHRAAGSYQCVPFDDVFAAGRAVPRFGGVHVVARPPGQPDCGTLFFLREDAADQAALADPSATTVDDVDAALRDAADRLNLD